MRSVSRLIVCIEFMRFVDVIEASAMTAFMFSFSASRLNGLRFAEPLLLSFFLSFDEPKKDDPVPALLFASEWAVLGVLLEGPAAARCCAIRCASSSSSSPKGFSSVSRMTFDLSCVTTFFFLGSSYHSQPGLFVEHGRSYLMQRCNLAKALRPLIRTPLSEQLPALLLHIRV
jgi:hypothetical protein